MLLGNSQNELEETIHKTIEIGKLAFKLIEKDKEFPVILARLYRNFYTALVDAGFTKDEAMQLICHQGTPASSVKIGE